MVSTLEMPFAVGKVFDAMKDIFDCLPFVVKAAVIGCFSIACMFAVLKMLF